MDIWVSEHWFPPRVLDVSPRCVAALASVGLGSSPGRRWDSSLSGPWSHVFFRNLRLFLPPKHGELRSSQLSALTFFFFFLAFSLHFLRGVDSSLVSAPQHVSPWRWTVEKERTGYSPSLEKPRGVVFSRPPRNKTRLSCCASPAMPLLALEDCFCWWSQCLQHFLCFLALSLWL